ncbi:hypothetical protein JYQ62_09270 [Nostoc sp. UHCC 0702]|nr:hypothetical protein JYQ62_09270 [Nostoc sp. UHCC 0702]
MSCRNAIACASCVHYSIHLYSILAIACASCVSPVIVQIGITYTILDFGFEILDCKSPCVSWCGQINHTQSLFKLA